MLAGCGGALSPPTFVQQKAVAITSTHPTVAKIVLVGSGWEGPVAVAIDGKGNVYVADYALGDVKEVSPPFTGRTHGKMRLIVGDFSPEGVAVDSKGNVYANNGGEIEQITPQGVKNLVATGGFSWGGLAVDDHENVYVASSYLYRIAHKSGGGWQTPVELKEKVTGLLDVARDALGNLYVPNGEPSVYKIEPNGKLVTVGSGFKASFGVAVVAGCKAPCAVYVADQGNNAIKKVSPPFTGSTHGKITEIGYGFSSPDSVAAKGVDVYVADTGNAQVKEVIP